MLLMQNRQFEMLLTQRTILRQRSSMCSVAYFDSNSGIDHQSSTCSPSKNNFKAFNLQISSQISIRAAMDRNWDGFWTREESCILWNNFPTGSCVPLDGKVPESVEQTIGSMKLMLTLFLLTFTSSEKPKNDSG
jgi:hypothetical protein